jgi:hypothetical protein
MSRYIDLAYDLIKRGCITPWEREWLETADMDDDRIAVLHTQREVAKWKLHKHQAKSFHEYWHDPHKSLRPKKASRA